MISTLPRRIIFAQLLAVILCLAFLRNYLNNSGCWEDSNCLVAGIWITGVILVTTTTFLTYLLAIITSRTLSQIVGSVRKITSGEPQSLILAKQGLKEIGDLSNALNIMTENFYSQINSLNQDRLHLVIMSAYMADGVMISDKKGTIQLINPSAAQLLNTTIDKALHRSLAEILRHHQLIELWQHCQLEGKEQIAAVEIGDKHFIQAAVKPFQEGSSGGFLVILQELTEIRRLERIRRDFISNLSHELRTPLASLRAIVETLQNGALEDPPASHRFLDLAEREVDTLTQMVQELLELSRIESGQVPLHLKQTPISELFTIPFERLRPQAEKKQIKFVLNLTPDLPVVIADSDRVQQVITNLLHNAIKFTSVGGKITATAYTSEIPQKQSHSVATHQNEVVIEIQDTGQGIADSDLPRIFERFYKSDRARTRGLGGTGLGLAIARHIVQAHEGRIWVKSKEGKGSTFYFTLPIVQDSTKTLTSPSSTHEIVST